MSLFVYLNGSDIGSTRVRLRANGEEGVTGLSSAADGTGSQGGIVFDDPIGNMTVTGWMPITVDEPLCTTAPRLFTGYVADRTYRRSPEKFRTAAAREIDTTINDQNALLSLRLIYNQDGKRPAETDIQRIDWLLGSIYLPDVFDLGLVDRSQPHPLQEADYRGQYPADVLSDITGQIRRIAFAIWNQSAHKVELFYDLPDATTYTSTLTVSNVLSDVTRDASGNVTGTCYPPSIDGELVRDPSEVYSKIRYTYRNGTIIGNNLTTQSTFFPPPLGYRGLQVTSDRVGLESTARSHAQDILTRDSVEADSLTFTVQLPASKVGLVDAGMRIGVRFSHLPGYDPQVFTRIQSRNYQQAEGNPDLYDVTLVCSTQATGPGGGGGDPGVFPAPTPSCDASAVTLVQWAGPATSAAPTITLPTAPIEGNLLIYAQIDRTTPSPTPPPPDAGTWTFIRAESTGGGGVSVGLHYKIVEAGDPAAWLCTGLGTNDYGRIFEFAGVSTLDTDNGAVCGLSADQLTTLTPTAGKVALLFSIAGTNFASGTGGLTMTPATGMTLIVPATPSTPQGPPSVGINYQVVPSTSATYTVGSTGDTSGFETTVVVAAAFVCDASAIANPPMPGQWVYGETVSMVGDVGTTLYPYADGSLTVWVDNVDQTAAVVSYNGAVGTFRLAFIPRASEVVVVNYQGR
jgi:hypothetical protein